MFWVHSDGNNKEKGRENYSEGNQPWFGSSGVTLGPTFDSGSVTALSELQLFGWFFFFGYLLWTSCYMTVLPCASSGGNGVEAAPLPKFISCVTSFVL